MSGLPFVPFVAFVVVVGGCFIALMHPEWIRFLRLIRRVAPTSRSTPDAVAVRAAPPLGESP